MHIENKHTIINKDGFKESTGWCEECNYKYKILTQEERLYNLLEEKEYKIEYKKNMG